MEVTLACLIYCNKRILNEAEAPIKAPGIPCDLQSSNTWENLVEQKATMASVSYRSVRTGGSSAMIGSSGYGGSSSRGMGFGMGTMGLSMGGGSSGVGGGSYRVGSAGMGMSGFGGMGISSRAVGMSAYGGGASGGAGGLVSGGMPMIGYGGGAGGFIGGVSPGIMASPAFTAGRAITSAGMSGVVGTLGPAGGMVPSFMSRDEVKNILGTLNQRLASYVDKVRQLTIENETLEEDLKNLTGGVPMSPDSSVNLENVETQVTEMLTEVSNLTLERVRLEIDVDHLRATADEIKSKYEFELGVRMQLETDITNMKRDLEAANDMRVDLDSKFQFLTEELTFQRKTQMEEINNLKQQFGRLGPVQTSVIEVDNVKAVNLTEALNVMREEYQQVVTKNVQEAETYCKMQIDQIQGISTQTTEQISILDKEINAMEKELQPLNVEYQRLLTTYQILGDRLTDLQNRENIDLVQFQNTYTRYEQEIEGNQVDLQRQLVTYQQLLEMKTALDSEIATYKKLLEGQETMVRTAMADDFAHATVVRSGTAGGASSIGGGYGTSSTHGVISGGYSTGGGASYSAGGGSSYNAGGGSSYSAGGGASYGVGGGYSGGTSAVMEGGSSGCSAMIGGQSTYSSSSMKRSASGSSSGGYGTSGHDTTIVLQQ
uniref:thread biopolymer filament subunit gamma-like n=1 Tax=Myxine glutinosa TaxID=7769 RepID=UPI00358E4BF1